MTLPEIDGKRVQEIISQASDLHHRGAMDQATWLQLTGISPLPPVAGWKCRAHLSSPAGANGSSVCERASPKRSAPADPSVRHSPQAIS